MDEANEANEANQARTGEPTGPGQSDVALPRRPPTCEGNRYRPSTKGETPWLALAELSTLRPATH
jgi:hypothetical protein